MSSRSAACNLLDGHYGRSSSLQPSHLLDAGDGMADGDGAYVKPVSPATPHAGAVYVVDGCSGMVELGSLDHPAMHSSQLLLGSLILDVNRNRLDAAFLDYQGVISDHFTILKGEPAPPARPLGLAAVVAGWSAIDLSWNDNASDETGWRIERSADGRLWSEIAVLAADATAHRDLGLAPRSTYTYRVRSTNLGGDSAESNLVAATTDDCLPVTAPVPASLRLVRTVGGARASWPDLPDVSYHRLYQDTAAGGPFATMAGETASGTPGLDLPWPPEPVLFYRVAGGNPCGEGPK